MDDLLVVGVADDLGDLADQVEPRVDAQLVLLLGQEVVEPDGQRVVFQDQGRADFVLGEVVGPQDAGMLEGFQELELPQGGPFNRLAVIGRGPAADEVEADAAAGVGDLGMDGLPVLVAGAFAHELLQDVVADLAVPLRGADAGLFHGLADDPGHGAVMDALGSLDRDQGNRAASPRRGCRAGPACRLRPSRSRRQTRNRPLPCNSH